MSTSKTGGAKVSKKAPKSTGSLYVNILLSIAVVLVTLTFVEIGLRVADYNPLARQPPKSIVELRVHTPYQSKVVNVSQIYPDDPYSEVHIDDRSYIKPSFQHDNPDVTIAFMGASTTECSAVHEQSRFHAVVAREFEERGIKVNALNAAHAGNTMQDSINIFFNHVIFDRPQIAVIMHAANDVGILAQHGGDYHMRAERELRFYDVVDWFKSTASMRLYLAGVLRQSLIVGRGSIGQPVPGELKNRKQKTDPNIARKLPIERYTERLRTFVHMARNFGAQPVLLTQPFSGSQNELTPDWTDLGSQDLVNEIIRQVGSEENVLVIDLVKHLKTNIPDWDQPMKVFYDGLHVTDFGSEIFAAHIVEELEPLVRHIAAE